MSDADMALATIKSIILLVMLGGLVGLVIPVIPGLVIIWVGALTYGVITGFGHWAAILIMVIITLLMLFGFVVDNIIMGASAKEKGASWLSVALSTLAGIIGSIVLPPFGGIVLALIVIFVVEYLRVKNWRQAFTSTKSMAFGCGWSVVARIGLGIVMILLWGAWTLWVPLT